MKNWNGVAGQFNYYNKFNEQLIELEICLVNMFLLVFIIIVIIISCITMCYFFSSMYYIIY